MAYGMLIDLKKCVGCQACTLNCKAANGTPPNVTRAKVTREVEGTYPDTHVIYYPQLCNHCAKPACVEACPTGASVQQENGIVTINKAECIGCKTCISACPYGARYYCETEEGYFGATLNEYEAVAYATMPNATVDKCDFCTGNGRLDRGDKPACVAACVAGARVFGDLEEIKAEAAAHDGFQLLPEEGTEPSVWYIPKVYHA